MKSDAFSIEPETPQHMNAVDALAAEAFGPGRFARSAFRLREGKASEPGLSFVATQPGADNAELLGSVKLTRILIGEKEALLLGPLVVTPRLKNSGIGAALMRHSIEAAQKTGAELIVLVGDEPYYKKFGFSVIPRGQISLPGPVDPHRFLFLELNGGQIGGFAGSTRRFPD